MPADTASAAPVTDPQLLRYARAGADWRCAYCGSDQRRLDGRCANCGSAPAAEAIAAPAAPVPRVRRRWGLRVVALAAVVIAGLVWNARRPRDYRGTVSTVAWEHVIDVERYALRSHEGFRETLPAKALNVRSLGRRVHHQEQVLDHYISQPYSVRVPDGYTTEFYTAREACGQECTSIPETCREKCTSNKNGYASCRTVCTGGGQRCKTRYCSESRTRQVPKTRTEVRTRQVPIFRSEPRYAEAFAYQAWEWAPERTVRESGNDALELRWPAGARTAGLPAGEQERERRTSKYLVTLRYQDSETLRFEVSDPARFARFKTGSAHDIHREADLTRVDGMAIKPLQ